MIFVTSCSGHEAYTDAVHKSFLMMGVFVKRGNLYLLIAAGAFFLLSAVSGFAHPLDEHEEHSPSGVLHHMHKHHSHQRFPARVFFEHLTGISIGLPYYSAGLSRHRGEFTGFGGQIQLQAGRPGAESASL